MIDSLLSEVGRNQSLVISAGNLFKGSGAFAKERAGLILRAYGIMGYDVIVPGPDDFDLCRNIPGIMLTGPHNYLDFFQLAGVLKRAGFVVGNDSGPSHLAAHLGVPGIAIFSGHVPAYRTGIERDNFKCIETERMDLIPVEKVCSEIISHFDRLAKLSGKA